MYDNNSRGISYTAGFFILIAFAIAGFVFAFTIDIWIWQHMTGTGSKEMTKALENPDPAYASVMQIMQLINAMVGFFIPAVATALLMNRRPMKLLGFSPRIKTEQVGLTILIIGASLLVSTSLSYFNSHIPIPGNWKVMFDKWESDYNKQVEGIISLKTGNDYILSLLIMAFLPAVCEETFFRGGLQNFLTKATKRAWISIIIVSILFSLAHGSYYGFLSRFFLGIILGTLFQYSGKLWLSILAHFLNNALALTLLFVYTQKGKSMQDVMKNETSSPWGIIVLVVVISLFILFKRVSATNRRPD